MRILRLSLQAFGPFTDVTLDPSAGNFGLHVIYGPNEAGKSSALRALRQVLYGIPGNSPDNFVHPYKNLRIGAAIRGNDGEVVEFIRRKGTKNTLLLADDKTVLDEAVLQSRLGGVDQAFYETMFGIDHESLVQGGQAIVRGAGEIGQILFAAGSGIADLRAVEKKLGEEMLLLFKPGGSNPAINKALSELDRARKAVRESQLLSSQWVEREKSLKLAQGRLAELEQQIREISGLKARFERLHDALTPMAEYNQLTIQLAELGTVRILRDDFSEQRREAVVERNAAEAREKDALAAICELSAVIDRPSTFENVLAEAEAIEQVREDLGSHRKAQRDLPGLIDRRTRLEADAREMLSEIRPDIDLGQMQQLHLTKKQQVEIQNLGNVHKALLLDSEQAEVAIAKLESELATVENQLDSSRAVPNATELQAAVRHAQSEGDLDQQVKEAEDGLWELQDRARIGLKSLTLWNGTLHELECMAIPTSETIDRMELQFTEIDQRSIHLAERLKDVQTHEAEVERQIQQLRLQQDVPTEEQLVDARLRRDELWRQIVADWSQQAPDSGRSTSKIGADSTADAGARLEEYSRCVRTADELADRLRREAERVATNANLESDRRRWLAQIETLSADKDQAAQTRQQLADEWNALWQPIGIAPLPPREMRAWSHRQQTLAQTAELIRKQERRLGDLRGRLDAARSLLSRAWVQLEQPTPCRDELLPAIVERAETFLAHVQLIAETERQLKKDVSVLRKKLDEARIRSRESNQRLVDWLSQWAKSMSLLGLPESANPSQAVEAMTHVSDLENKLKLSRDLRERIEGIERDAQQFTERVRGLAERVAPEFATLPIEHAAQELLNRLKLASAEREQHEARAAEKSRELAKLEKARDVIRIMEGRLVALCHEAGCQEIHQLPEAERISAEAKELSAKIHGLEKQLLRVGGGATVAEFMREAAGSDPDSLPAKIAELTEQLNQLTAEKLRLHEVKGGEENALQQMDGERRAADAAEDAQGLLAQIESSVQEYVRLRLASAVLREGINRYREKNQGPVLARASTIFSGLTLGSFSGLSIDFNDKGDAILVGVRSGGKETIHVNGMSDGTADQLYLALRLASLETYLERKQPIPFTVDDLLINFDDERALATLKELARFSSRTQILFFTHHKHLVELAETHLDPSVLFVHRLRNR